MFRNKSEPRLQTRPQSAETLTLCPQHNPLVCWQCSTTSALTLGLVYAGVNLLSEPCVRAGTAGDNPNRAVAQELLANPDWGLLAMPLIGAVQNIVQLSVLKGVASSKN